ncbi:hypothetical protein [Haloarchaeobius sp. DFWS5]|uniref:hypothetical protein n=1 Tax=Haloarchaeobius sp. DFWS5 TaxID=3446114 RepID=UPI003EC0B90D
MGSASFDGGASGTGGGNLRSVLRPIQRAGFWTAISLPLAHVGLLTYGIETPGHWGLFLALLAVNLVALLVGHAYEP